MENEWGAAIGVGIFFIFAIGMTILVDWLRKKKIEPRIKRIEDKLKLKKARGKWKS